MKLVTPEIAWHGKEPVLSVDFCKIGAFSRLASAGADTDIKIWSVTCSENGSNNLKFLSNLTRHTKAVNVVRFSPKEELLASAGDDSVVFIWKLTCSSEHQHTLDDENDNLETWTVSKMLRGHIEDVYDLAWSPDGTQLLSGSVDNSAIIWDAIKGTKLTILKDHKHYVQGVCWDPLGQYVVTNSSDRSCRLYNSLSYRCCYNINKLSANVMSKNTEKGEAIKPTRMFHDEAMLTFFRRPTFTPDGTHFIVPAGKLELQNQVVHTTYIFSRNSPSKPVCFLQSPKKPTVAVRCCPAVFELRDSKESDKENSGRNSSLSKLPYRMVFAVATLDAVLLYDTQQQVPFAYVSNIHYSGISDMAWSNNGSTLVISSTDGYCSMLYFKDGELGTPYKHSLQEILETPPITMSTPHAGKPSNTSRNSPTVDSPENVSRKIILNQVNESQPAPTSPLVEKSDPGLSKKKETRGIDQFTVPLSQIKETKPVTTRRVPLTSPSVPSGTTSTDHSQPRRVQLVTMPVPGQMVRAPPGQIVSPAGLQPVYLISGQNVVPVTVQNQAGQAVNMVPMQIVKPSNQGGQVIAVGGKQSQGPVQLVSFPGNVVHETGQENVSGQGQYSTLTSSSESLHPYPLRINANWETQSSATPMCQSGATDTTNNQSPAVNSSDMPSSENSEKRRVPFGTVDQSNKLQERKEKTIRKHIPLEPTVIVLD